MSGTGDAGAAGANGAAAAGANGAADAGAAGAAAAAFDWTKQGLDADTSSYVAGKGWKGPGDLVASYRGVEKLIGVPADQVIKLPQGSEITPQQWNEQVYDRLGRPKEVGGYELGKLVPAGGDTKFADAAAGKFHELGLNTRQAQELTKWWNGQAGEMTAAQTAAATLRDTQQISSLKAEWGNQFDSNAALVDKAASTFGMTPEQVTALKASMGPAGAMKFLHTIGTKLGVSDTFINPDQRQTNFAGAMSQDQAKAEIDTLKKDKAFMDKYTKGDAESKRRFGDLHARAFPGTITG